MGGPLTGYSIGIHRLIHARLEALVGSTAVVILFSLVLSFFHRQTRPVFRLVYLLLPSLSATDSMTASSSEIRDWLLALMFGSLDRWPWFGGTKSQRRALRFNRILTSPAKLRTGGLIRSFHLLYSPPG